MPVKSHETIILREALKRYEGQNHFWLVVAALAWGGSVWTVIWLRGHMPDSLFPVDLAGLVALGMWFDQRKFAAQLRAELRREAESPTPRPKSLLDYF
jgi:hypothetical protein